MYDIVEVVWLDASGRSSWHPLKEAPKIKVLVINCVGYLIFEDGEKVVIAASIDSKDDPDIADETTIPRVCIKKMRILKRKK